MVFNFHLKSSHLQPLLCIEQLVYCFRKDVPNEIDIWLTKLCKQIALPNMGGPHQSLEGVKRIKGWVRKNSFSQIVSEQGGWCSAFGFGLELSPLAFLILRALDQLDSIFGSSVSLACWLQILDVSLHKYMSQFLAKSVIISLSFNMHIYAVYNYHIYIFLIYEIVFSFLIICDFDHFSYF